MLIAAGGPRRLGVEMGARLHFESPTSSFARLPLADEHVVFGMSPPCGTCQLLFERRGDAEWAQDVDDTARADGSSNLEEEVIAEYGQLLPAGDYVPLLVEVVPQLVRPAGPGRRGVRRSVRPQRGDHGRVRPAQERIDHGWNRP